MSLLKQKSLLFRDLQLNKYLSFCKILKYTGESSNTPHLFKRNFANCTKIDLKMKMKHQVNLSALKLKHCQQT